MTMPSFEKQFNFPSNASALAAAKAVSFELKNGFDRNAGVFMDTNKNLVLLRIVSSDRQALDASVNSFGRLLSMCVEIATGESHG